MEHYLLDYLSPALFAAHLQSGTVCSPPSVQHCLQPTFNQALFFSPPLTRHWLQPTFNHALIAAHLYFGDATWLVDCLEHLNKAEVICLRIVTVVMIHTNVYKLMCFTIERSRSACLVWRLQFNIQSKLSIIQLKAFALIKDKHLH